MEDELNDGESMLKKISELSAYEVKTKLSNSLLYHKFNIFILYIAVWKILGLWRNIYCQNTWGMVLYGLQTLP